MVQGWDPSIDLDYEQSGTFYYNCTSSHSLSLDAADQTEEKILHHTEHQKLKAFATTEEQTQILTVWCLVKIHNQYCQAFLEYKFWYFNRRSVCWTKQLSRRDTTTQLKQVCQALKLSEGQRPGSLRGLSGNSVCAQTASDIYCIHVTVTDPGCVFPSHL